MTSWQCFEAGVVAFISVEEEKEKPGWKSTKQDEQWMERILEIIVEVVRSKEDYERKHSPKDKEEFGIAFKLCLWKYLIEIECLLKIYYKYFI